MCTLVEMPPTTHALSGGALCLQITPALLVSLWSRGAEMDSCIVGRCRIGCIVVWFVSQIGWSLVEVVGMRLHGQLFEFPAIIPG